MVPPIGSRLLVVEDDPASARLVQAIFGAEGLEVMVAVDGPSGLERALSERPDVMLLDLNLPGLSGLGVLDRLKHELPLLPVVMLTASNDLKSAIKATQLGAVDYLTKPVDPEEVVRVVRRALETRALKAELLELRERVRGGVGLERLMGHSAEVKAIVDQVNAVAASDFSVLLLGETGTGKDLVAEALHRSSPRHAGPFIALDCGAIPEPLLESELFGHEKGAFTGAESKRVGSFQLAEGGTLLLDEVGNLPIALQAKLLRVLESREVRAVGGTEFQPMNVRFIAATNSDLKARVKEGQFRADLYFRLAQYTITLAPLRARRADVEPLALRFMEEASLELRRPVREISREALLRLEAYAWPGNVRELRNVVRRAVLEAEAHVISESLVASFIEEGSTDLAQARPLSERSLKEIADDAAKTAERHAIIETLRSTGGNKSQAARALRTDYKTLHLKMKNLGINARDFEER